MNPVSSPLVRALLPVYLTIIDMGALRPRHFDWDFLPDDLRQEIVSIDAYVTIPDVEPSKPLNPVPRGE